VTEGANPVTEGGDLTAAAVSEAMGVGAQPTAAPGLPPVANKALWGLSGLVLQIVGVGAPIAYVLIKAKHEDVGGQITRATFRLAWHQAVHSHAGLALLIGGVAVFAAGCVLLARPFVKSRVTLLLAIPVAAVAGALVLGAAALLVVALFAALNGFDFDFGGGGGGSGGGNGGGSGGGNGGGSGGGNGGGSIAGDAADFASSPSGSSSSRKRDRDERETLTG
jgi:uncharacterized membrane protein YgcG